MAYRVSISQQLLTPSVNGTFTEEDVVAVLARVKTELAPRLTVYAVDRLALNINTGAVSRYCSIPNACLDAAVRFKDGDLGGLLLPGFKPSRTEHQHSGCVANFLEAIRWAIGPASKYRDANGVPFTNRSLFERNLLGSEIVYVGPPWMCNMVETLLIVMWNNSLIEHGGKALQFTNGNYGGIGNAGTFGPNLSVVTITHTNEPIEDLVVSGAVKVIRPPPAGSGTIRRHNLLDMLTNRAIAFNADDHRNDVAVSSVHLASFDPHEFKSLNNGEITAFAVYEKAVAENSIEMQIHLTCVKKAKKQDKFYSLTMVNVSTDLNLYSVIRHSGQNSATGPGAFAIFVHGQSKEIALSEFNRKLRQKLLPRIGYTQVSNPPPIKLKLPEVQNGHTVKEAEESDLAEAAEEREHQVILEADAAAEAAEEDARADAEAHAKEEADQAFSAGEGNILQDLPSTRSPPEIASATAPSATATAATAPSATAPIAATIAKDPITIVIESESSEEGGAGPAPERKRAVSSSESDGESIGSTISEKAAGKQPRKASRRSIEGSSPGR
jgi:hypothetical protein